MGLNLDALLLAVHLLAAAAWLGAGWYDKLLIAPAIRQAGSAGLPVLRAKAARGGAAAWFAPASILTVVTGAVLYGRIGVDVATTSGAMLVAGAGLGVIAVLMGPLVHMPAERALTQALALDDEKAIFAHARRLGRRTDFAGYLVGAAFLLMSLRHVVS